jgi:hypothetical protein
VRTESIGSVIAYEPVYNALPTIIDKQKYFLISLIFNSFPHKIYIERQHKILINSAGIIILDTNR